MSDLIWHTEKRKVSELKLLENNPRTITDEGFKRLQKDIKELGNFRPLVCDLDGTVLGGNQRKRVADLSGDVEIEVSIPNRELTEEERKKVIILDNEHRGEFDIDILANEFEDILKVLGFTEYLKNDTEYIRTVKSPIYEPSGKCPSLYELVDKKKYDELLGGIEKSDISDEIKDFLRYAATRFLVFDYGKIAEYYCHSDNVIKEIFERLALIIVDYDKAVENGFVEFIDEIMDIQRQDYPDE